MKQPSITRALVGLALGFAAANATAATPAKPVVTETRMYVLDCGAATNNRPENYNLTREEVKTPNWAVMCFLIAHPKGVLLWDTGLPDRFLGRPFYEIYDSKSTQIFKYNTLVGQLADIGYTPEMIDFLSISHSHFDHSGNGNTFAASTWLVARAEFDEMFAGPKRVGYEDYSRLKDSKKIFVPDNYDVFGDGTAIIKRASGHTPGSSVLQVKLKKTGNRMLVGDLYHYMEEMTLGRMPEREKTTGTRESRARIEAAAQQIGAPIWLAHDLELFISLKKSPAYYD